MWDLSIKTHKYFIESLSERKHIKSVLIKRFLSFIEHLKKSPKIVARKLLKTIKHDTSSVTGSNLRNIMLLVKKTTIEDLNPTESDNVQYCPVDEDNIWKIGVAKELLEVQSGNMELPNFKFKEIQQMISFICTT